MFLEDRYVECESNENGGAIFVYHGSATVSVTTCVFVACKANSAERFISR
jgi:hypothetical protein